MQQNEAFLLYFERKELITKLNIATEKANEVENFPIGIAFCLDD